MLIILYFFLINYSGDLKRKEEEKHKELKSWKFMREIYEYFDFSIQGQLHFMNHS
jgi:hypothetical protein